ncbi:ABC transporter substrate-binding protein [Acidobacteriota bacterium]
MKSKFWTVSLVFLCAFVSCRRPSESLYTIGIFQINDAPTMTEVRKGFIKALEDSGFRNSDNIKLIIKNAMGDIQAMQRIAQDLAAKKVDMLVPFSTPSLQAALHASREIPIVFSSVANPFLAGAGNSAYDHLSFVTGVSSKGPIKQSLEFIRKVFPEKKRIGTLWTPSEINSQYYLNLAEDAAKELGFDLISVPVAKSSDILLAAQDLINKKIDVLYQISDNTINASFEALSRVAEENSIPLFGGFLLSTREGASAALGWDFYDMGYKAGLMAVRVKEGESPAAMPIQYMMDVHLHINLTAAKKQGLVFSDDIIKLANTVLSEESRKEQEEEREPVRK